MFKFAMFIGFVLLTAVSFNCSHTHNCMIMSDPPGAKISINNEYQGETPNFVVWTSQNLANEITVEVSKIGYIPLIVKTNSDTQKLHFVLQPIPQEEHLSSTKENGLPLPEEFVPYDVQPIKLNEAEIKYPAKALAFGTEGTVWVKVLIDKEGKVRDALIVKDSGTNLGFEEAALKGAYEIAYKPASYKGTPVAVWVVYDVNFSVKKKTPIQDTLSDSLKDRK